MQTLNGRLPLRRPRQRARPWRRSWPTSRPAALERVYCLGDLVGYGPEPNGRHRPDPCRRDPVHPRQLRRRRGLRSRRLRLLLRGRRRPGPSATRPIPVHRRRGHRRATRRGCASLPRELRLEAGGHRFHLVHGSPRRINEYLLTDRDQRTFERLAAAEEADVLVFGHTHAPGTVCTAACFSSTWGRWAGPRTATRARPTPLLRLGPGLVEAETVRVAYDAEDTARAVLAVGLPAGLAESFRTGRA